jgi:hypothetical protein
MGFPQMRKINLRLTDEGLPGRGRGVAIGQLSNLEWKGPLGPVVTVRQSAPGTDVGLLANGSTDK